MENNINDINTLGAEPRGAVTGESFTAVLEDSNGTAHITGAVDAGGNINTHGNVDISHVTYPQMAPGVFNPCVTFSELYQGSRIQTVFLMYTDHDAYRGPAGLKVFGNNGDSSPAWFEVEGKIFCPALVLTSSQGYGSEYPDSPVAGQIFFKKV